MGSLTQEAMPWVRISLAIETTLAKNVLCTVIAGEELFRFYKLFTIAAFSRMINYCVWWHLRGPFSRKGWHFRSDDLFQECRQRVKVRNVLGTIALLAEREGKVSIFRTVDTEAFETLILAERWYESVYIFLNAHFLRGGPLMSVFALTVLRLERDRRRLTDRAGIADCVSQEIESIF